METKKEVKYLDMSAHAELNVQEILERLARPPEKTTKEDAEDDSNG